MNKKSPSRWSRLRAMFASMRARGLLRKQQKMQAKADHAAKKYYEAYKKTDYGLSGMSKDEKEIIRSNARLMRDLGMLKPLTEREIQERARRMVYAGELEKGLRHELTEEYKNKYGWQKTLHDAIIAGLVGVPPVSSSSEQPPDIELGRVSREQLERAGTQLLRSAKPTVRERLAKLYTMQVEGKISQAEGQRRMHELAEKVQQQKERREKERRYNRPVRSTDPNELAREEWEKGAPRKRRRRIASTEDIA